MQKHWRRAKSFISCILDVNDLQEWSFETIYSVLFREREHSGGNVFMSENFSEVHRIIKRRQTYTNHLAKVDIWNFSISKMRQYGAIAQFQGIVSSVNRAQENINLPFHETYIKIWFSSFEKKIKVSFCFSPVPQTSQRWRNKWNRSFMWKTFK